MYVCVGVLAGGYRSDGNCDFSFSVFRFAHQILSNLADVAIVVVAVNILAK